MSVDSIESTELPFYIFEFIIENEYTTLADYFLLLRKVSKQFHSPYLLRLSMKRLCSKFKTLFTLNNTFIVGNFLTRILHGERTTIDDFISKKYIQSKYNLTPALIRKIRSSPENLSVEYKERAAMDQMYEFNRCYYDGQTLKVVHPASCYHRRSPVIHVCCTSIGQEIQWVRRDYQFAYELEQEIILLLTKRYKVEHHLCQCGSEIETTAIQSHRKFLYDSFGLRATNYPASTTHNLLSPENPLGIYNRESVFASLIDIAVCDLEEIIQPSSLKPVKKFWLNRKERLSTNRWYLGSTSQSSELITLSTTRRPLPPPVTMAPCRPLPENPWN